MENAIATLEGLKEKIVENVKVTFFNLLPDAEFNKLVESEIKAFFESTVNQFDIKAIESGYYGRSDRVTLVTPVSPFRAIVWAECKKIVDQKLNGLFAEEGFFATTCWNGNGEYPTEKAELSEKLKEELRKQANELASSFFSTMFAQAFNTVAPKIVEETKNRIRAGY